MPASFGLQTRLLIFRVCICLGLLLPGCYSATARMPAWARNQPLAQNGFVVHPEPGISPLAVEVVTARIADVRDSLRAAYFPTITAFDSESPLQLVLYRDYRSYRAHTTMLVETLARYDRRLH
ncbi:MAG: hypothetical protein KDK27_05570, partial [Leptospiraceae bacterium]|nr:hypothetical protein [Leptospiraceae bacterium]